MTEALVTNIHLTWSRRCRSWAAAWVMAIGFVGCSDGDSLTSPTSPSQLDGTWRLIRMMTSEGVHNEELAAGRFNVTFTDGTLQAKADCNLCNGPAGLSGATLTVGPVACTRAACDSAPLDTRFANLLDGTFTVRVNATLLQLNDAQGNELRFQK